MLQLLAAIPTILTAISKVSELFQKGRDVVEEVTNQPSQASTPDELRSEVEQLTPEQQNRWAEIMSKEVDKYVAQNERLATEIGLVDANITGKLSEDAASKVAIMRMTTRPWAVRWMVFYILFPFFLVIIDMAQELLLTWLPFLSNWISPYSTFEHFFGVMNFPDVSDAKFIEKVTALFSSTKGPTTFAGYLYMESLPWVVSIILSYMGLREIGKWRNPNDIPGQGSAASQPSTVSVVRKTLTEGANLVSSVSKWFKK